MTWWLPIEMGVLPSFIHSFCSECQYHLNIMFSASHRSFLRDIISYSSERLNTLVLLHLGGKEEKTERPTAV